MRRQVLKEIEKNPILNASSLADSIATTLLKSVVHKQYEMYYTPLTYTEDISKKNRS